MLTQPIIGWSVRGNDLDLTHGLFSSPQNKTYSVVLIVPVELGYTWVGVKQSLGTYSIAFNSRRWKITPYQVCPSPQLQ